MAMNKIGACFAEFKLINIKYLLKKPGFNLAPQAHAD